MKNADAIKALLMAAIDEIAADPRKDAACDGSAVDIFPSPNDPDTFLSLTASPPEASIKSISTLFTPSLTGGSQTW